MIVAVVAGTLFLRGTIETNTIQSGTLYLGLIFLSIVSALPRALPGFWCTLCPTRVLVDPVP